MIRRKRLLVGVAVISTLLLTLFFNLPMLIEITLKYQLTRLGMTNPVINISQIGLHTATVSKLEFSHRIDDRKIDLASHDIQLSYHLSGLITGQLGRVVVSTTDIKIDNQSASAKDVSRVSGIISLPDVSDIPFDSLHINKARVFIKQEDRNSVQLDASGLIEKKNNGVEASLEVVQAGYAGVQANMSVTQDGNINLLVQDLDQHNVLISMRTEKLTVIDNFLNTQLKTQADFEKIVELLHAWGFAQTLNKVSGHLELVSDIHTPLDPSLSVSQWLDKTQLLANMTLDMTVQQWSGIGRKIKVNIPLAVSINEGLLSWELSDTAQINIIPEFISRFDVYEFTQGLSTKVEGQSLQIAFPGGLHGQTRASNVLAQEKISSENVINVVYGKEAAVLQLQLLLQSPSFIVHPEIQLSTEVNYKMQIAELSSPHIRRMNIKGSGVFNIGKDKANITFNKNSELSVDGFRYDNLDMKNAIVSLSNTTQCQMHWLEVEKNWRCSPFSTRLVFPDVTLGDVSVDSSKGVINIRELSKDKSGLNLKSNIQFTDLKSVLNDYVLKFNRFQADIGVKKSRINGKAKVHAAGGAVEAEATLSHDLVSGKGMIDYRLLPVDFSASKSLLAKIVTNPQLPVQVNSGLVSVNGRYGWKAARKKSDKPLIGQLVSDISLQNVNGRFSNIEFQGLSSDLAFGGNAGLLFAKPADVTIALINAGVPVTDIRFKLHGQVDRNNKAHISLDNLSANTLDGSLDSRKIELDLNRSSNPFIIHFHQLSMAKLLQLEEDQGLSGTGVIDGVLPFDYKSGQGLFMQKGKVYAKEPGGLLIYKATDRVKKMANSNPNIKILLDALNNFNYNKLDADADYTPDGKLSLKVSLKGKNPEFQKGRPVHLNVNVEENILQLMRSLQLGDEIGERLGERVLKQ